MAYQLEEINRKLRTDPAAFVAECDGVYQTRLESAADRILERMKQSPIEKCCKGRKAYTRWGSPFSFRPSTV